MQPAQASELPVGFGHFWGSLVLYLASGNDSLTHTKGRTSSDTENGLLKPAKLFQLLQGGKCKYKETWKSNSNVIEKWKRKEMRKKVIKRNVWVAFFLCSLIKVIGDVFCLWESRVLGHLMKISWVFKVIRFVFEGKGICFWYQPSRYKVALQSFNKLILIEFNLHKSNVVTIEGKYGKCLCRGFW